MGRIIDGMHGGLQSLQGFADRRDSKKKVTALYFLTAFIIVLSAASAVWMLVQLKILSCAFDLAVAGLGVLGFHATRHRHRSLLLLFVVGMAVLVGLGLLGLALAIVYSVFSLSFELLYIVVQLFLIAIEGFALILAYSLSKDLDPKRVVTMGAPHDGSAMEAGEQVFTFEDTGAMVNAPAPVYHQQPTTTPLGGNMPVYDPATGTYGGYPGQPMYNPYAPQMAVYPPPQAMHQQYAYPPPQAMPYGSQQLPSVSPAPSVAAPAGDVFDFAQPNAAAEQGTYTIDDDDDEFDPFQEQPSAH